jgi:tetratricopeptide (TPR) repeat protein
VSYKPAIAWVLVALLLAPLLGKQASGASLFGTGSSPVYLPGRGGADAFDGKLVSCPCVIKVPDSSAPGGFTYMMYYDGRQPNDAVSVGLATSSDGTNWTRQGVNPVVGNARDASVLYEPDDAAAPFKMWYLRKSGSGKSEIRQATSTDGANWTDLGVAMSCGATGELDDGGLSGPCVVKEGGHYLMYYGASSAGLEGVLPGPQCLFLAESSNARDWTKIGPVLDGLLAPSSAASQNRTEDSIFLASVILLQRETGQEFLMFYEVGGKPRTIHLARSLDGRKWAKYPGNPVLTGTGTKGSFPYGTSRPGALVEPGGQTVRLWFSSQQEEPFGIGLASCSAQAAVGVSEQEIGQAPTSKNLEALRTLADAGYKAKREQYQEAISAYQLAVAAAPETGYARAAWMQLGDIWRNKIKDPAKAVEAYQAVIQKWPAHPDSAVAHDTLARIYLIEMSDPQKAVSEFAKVFPQWPEEPVARWSQAALGQVYMYHLHDYPNASAAFQVVVQRWPDDPLAAQSLLAMGAIYGELGQYDKAIETLRLLIAKFPHDPNLPAAKLWIAHNLLWLKQFEQALAQYSELASAGGQTFAEARYYRAYCQMMLQEYDRAIETFNQVATSDPEARRVVRARYMLAGCHAAEKNFAAAISQLDKILADGSLIFVEWHDDAHYLKADCLASAGRVSEALGELAIVLADYPTSPVAEPARAMKARLEEERASH